MYILLVGYPPFYADTKDGIFDAIEAGRYEMKGKEWKPITENAKDLIRKLLEVDEKKRIKVNEAIKHPFFNILNSQDSNSNNSDEEQKHT